GVPANRRGAFIGAWSGIAGLAVAFGPLVGGAVVSGISWHWIFWLNAPIGVALIPLALTRRDESHGPANRLDAPGRVLASAGLLAARLRAADPPVDDHADVRRAHRRCTLRSCRRRAPDGHRPDFAGCGVGVHCSGVHADYAVLATRRAVHGLGHRYGDVLGT